MSLPSIQPYTMPNKEEMPANRVDWKIDSERAVLLIHDMQQYFLNAFTAGQSPVTELINNIQQLKARCVELGIPVIYTAQPGAQDLSDRALLTDFWGPGLADDPELTGIIDELAPTENDTVLDKWRYSAFKKSDLKNIMLEQGRDQLIICGIYAHIGCLATATDAFMEDIQSFITADALADFSKEEHLMALNYAAGRCAVAVSKEQLLIDLSTAGDSRFAEKVMQDVCGILDEPAGSIGKLDDLTEIGMDSMRMMSLAEKWRLEGVELTFMELAEEPTVDHWQKLLDKASLSASRI